MKDYVTVNNGVNVGIECDAIDNNNGEVASLESCVFRQAVYPSPVLDIFFLFLQSPRRKAI